MSLSCAGQASKGHSMTLKRAGLMAVAFVFVLGTIGCEQANDNGTGSTAQTDEPNAKENGSNRPSLSGRAFPSEPEFNIDWQNTVVDVEPTSRLRDTQGGSDIAHVHTTLGLAEEPDGAQQEFLKNLEDVDVEIDDRIVRMTYEFEVEEIDENRYGFEIEVPVEFAEPFEKGDDVSAIVLLPRDADEYENAPHYTVELDEEATEEAAGDSDLQILQAEESPWKRITVALYDIKDPKLPPIFNYLP